MPCLGSLPSSSITNKTRREWTKWSETPQGSFIFTETCLTEVKPSSEPSKAAKTRPLVRNYSARWHLFVLCASVCVFVCVGVCVRALLFVPGSTGLPPWLSSDTAYTVVSLRLDCVSKKVDSEFALYFSPSSASTSEYSFNQGASLRWMCEKEGWFSTLQPPPCAHNTALWQSIGCS